MILTADNYFSTEASMYYTGSSQYKQFQECEAMALAVINGEWHEEKTTALLVGSYVDSYFEGTVDSFKEKNSNIFCAPNKKNAGELKSEYQHANYIIKRIERDEMFMKYMSGKKQVIMTGNICNVPIKIKIDVYHESKAIVDLKIMQSFDPIWKFGQRLNFINAWGYDIQGAIYQEIVYQNTGFKLPFVIAGATKEKPEPDLALIRIENDTLNYYLDEVKQNIVRVDLIKKGEIEPTRCGICNYCKSTKVLKHVIKYDSTLADIFEGV